MTKTCWKSLRTLTFSWGKMTIKDVNSLPSIWLTDSAKTDLLEDGVAARRTCRQTESVKTPLRLVEMVEEKKRHSQAASSVPSFYIHAANITHYVL